MDHVLKKLVTNFDNYVSDRYSAENKAHIMDLIDNGQRPEVLIIGCSDSRCAPETLFQAGQGNIFVQRHIAALVASFDQQDFCSVTAATVDFAIETLGVKHVIILGHTECGGIAGLCRGLGENDGPVGKWLSQASEVLDTVKAKSKTSDETDLPPIVEQESIKWSLNNLRTYPAVAKALKEQRVNIHGWQKDLKNGSISAYNADTDAFETLSPKAGNDIPNNRTTASLTGGKHQ